MHGDQSLLEPKVFHLLLAFFFVGMNAFFVAAEFALVKEHAIRGASVLQPLEILEPAVPVILHHHERYDGTGYPKGLKKEAIPLGARMIAVADTYQALVSSRPYRKAHSRPEALKILKKESGTKFDPELVSLFRKITE